ncbi:hypothetical protein SteCoe_6396 [Stentor coeruleus]|uniref:Acyltransferase 3 domain-containing protein n=1 Tax=Stentor coeruleus TaxID=5963 RepID=A0A1R2CQ56_9CILI|nr:hypothetical protein SteCoe_6396 [Stentor coeruleus]
MLYILIVLLNFLCTKGKVEECANEIKGLLDAIIAPPFTTNYTFMFTYSGIALNELGNYDDCNKLDYARYVIFYFSKAPVSLQSLCGPKICTKEDYQIIFSNGSYFLNNPLPIYTLSKAQSNKQFPATTTIVFPYDYQKDNYRTYTTGAIIMISISVTLSFISFLGTIYDIIYPKNSSVISNIIKCFSLLANGRKLLISRRKKDPLDILNGIRVLSLGWVLLGHTVLATSSYGPLNNLYTLPETIAGSDYIIIYAGVYAVDTFFWVSGFLFTFLALMEIDKTYEFTYKKIFMAYIHRILRITPTYMFCLFFFWALQKYLGNGPLYTEIDKLYNPDCEEYWYANLLYYNNFVPDWKSSFCFGASWYLAADMQLFVFVPLILWLYVRVKKIIGWVYVGIMCCSCCIASGIVAKHYNLNVSFWTTSQGDDYLNYYYYKPYSRLAPYSLGFACGLIVFTIRKYENKGTTYDKLAFLIGNAMKNIFIRSISMFIGLILINLLIFSQYSTYKHPGANQDYTHWSKTENYVFIALERFTYGLGISLIFLPLLLGYFKPIIWFLSFPPFSFFSRLCFVMFLIHFSILEISLCSQKNTMNFNPYTNAKDAIFLFILSSACALPIVLVVEMPLSNLESLIFSNFRNKTKAILEEVERTESQPMKLKIIY